MREVAGGHNGGKRGKEEAEGGEAGREASGIGGSRPALLLPLPGSVS